MSKETLQTLNNYTLIGQTDKRNSKAWHYRADLQGDEPNHYPGAIPVEDVRRRLFNWRAVEEQMTIRGGVPVKGFKSVVRSDNNTVLGIFKDSYTIHQYDEWLIDNVANLIDDNNLSIGSAGVLREGGIAWVTIEMPDNLTTSVGYELRPYLLATTSHNGTIATTYKQLCNAPVCDNSLFAGLGSDGAFHRTRHSKNSNMKIQNVRDALGIVFRMGENIVAEIERLGSITVTDREWDAIVNRLMPVGNVGDVPQHAISKMENKQEVIRSMYKNDPMVSPWQGSALGVLQAFNTYAHHVAGSNKNRAERNALNTIKNTIQQSDSKVLSVINELVLA